MIPTHWFLILSAILFTIGVCGVLTRKNGITIFMSIELMVNAVNLSFLAYARQFHDVHGLIFVFFIMAIAAAEAAADVAGTVVRPFFRTGVGADLKSDRSPVTIADRTAEDHAPSGTIGREGAARVGNVGGEAALDPTDGSRRCGCRGADHGRGARVLPWQPERSP